MPQRSRLIALFSTGDIMQARRSHDRGALARRLGAARISTHRQWRLGVSVLLLLAWAVHSQAEPPREEGAVLEQGVVLQALSKPKPWHQDLRLETAEAMLNERARLEHLANAKWEDALLRVLQDHWQSTEQDPPHLEVDLAVLARYFSAYPEVRKLIMDLHGKAWKLQFSPETFKTEVRGNRLQVSAVTVHFDLRTAAQFRFHNACSKKRPHCVASPADVLLHELLHAHIILTQPQRFIRQGGMGGAMYPYQHEQQTIAHEARLYRAMTLRDQQPRPLRTEHTGRPLLVHCATCVH